MRHGRLERAVEQEGCPGGLKRRRTDDVHFSWRYRTPSYCAGEPTTWSHSLKKLVSCTGLEPVLTVLETAVFPDCQQLVLGLEDHTSRVMIKDSIGLQYKHRAIELHHLDLQ